MVAHPRVRLHDPMSLPVGPVSLKSTWPTDKSKRGPHTDRDIHGPVSFVRWGRRCAKGPKLLITIFSTASWISARSARRSDRSPGKLARILPLLSIRSARTSPLSCRLSLDHTTQIFRSPGFYRIHSPRFGAQSARAHEGSLLPGSVQPTPSTRAGETFSVAHRDQAHCPPKRTDRPD